MLRQGALLHNESHPMSRRGFMSPRKTLFLAALISMAPTAMVMAQSQTMPSDTSPSSASSPSQRDSTSSSATESPTTEGTSPSAASTPHQQQATRVASKQAMKQCVAKQQSDNSGMSAADAKKACKAQMKGSG
jgi:cytoskeletal protein RodZ